MKRQLLLCLCLFVSILSGITFAQEKKDKDIWNEIQEYKIKYLAQEMDLKGEQKDKFVALYQEYSNLRHDNFCRLRKAEKNLKEDAPEDAYKQVADLKVEVKLKDAQLEKDYDEKFSQFLTPRQILKMKEAEEEFRRKLQEMHRKHGDKKGKKTKDRKK